MVNVRGRSIGLSRNQKVPSVLSKVKGRPVDTSSPLAASPTAKSTLFTHRARPSGGEEEATQRWSPDEASRRSSPVPSTTPKSNAKDWKLGGRGRKSSASDSSHNAERQGNAAVFNPPPAASDSEDDSEDDRKPSQAVRSGVDGLLLNDSDSDDLLARRGDLRPTAFTSHTTERVSTGSGRNAATPMRSSQLSSLSQPISSGGSHFENDVGHVRKPKAKQTYSKPKPQPKAMSKKTRKTFEEHVALESPEKRKILFQAPDDSDESPSSKPVKATARYELGLDTDSESGKKTPAKPVRKRKGRASSDNKPREEKKPKPIFWVPDASPDREIDKETPAKEVAKVVRRLSSSSISDLSLSDEELQTIAKNEKDSTCPWCGKHIRPEALKEFAKGRRLNVQMQTKFCRSHQKQTAKDDWNERGYPRIDWTSLPDRFRKHHDVLLNIVNGQSSFFRDALAADIRQGKSRTLRKEENLTPGYYGPHGFNIMSDFLVAQFSDLLKERAVSDRVIAGRGSAAFIQSVLVAELAVQLIKEDMGVDDGEARALLNESKELGEIVHEEA